MQICCAVDVKPLILLWIYLFVSVANAGERPWVLVDISANIIVVYHQDHIKEKFYNISMGRGGASDVRYEGSRKTPKGTFRVAWVNRNSQYHLFFGLDYPNKEHAEAAYRKKVIDWDTYYAIRKAVHRKQVPPQDTPLGGHIGIHGLGQENPRVHKYINWTRGCIALTNNQIDRLSRWVDVGTKVVIQ